MRKTATEAFVEAWDLTCVKSNCSNTATKIGLAPVDRNAPKTSQYVRNLTAEEQAVFDRRVQRNAEKLNINNCEITNTNKIAEIKATVQKNEFDKDLCTDISRFPSMKELYNFIRENAALHGVNTLSTPPPFHGTYFE